MILVFVCFKVENPAHETVVNLNFFSKREKERKEGTYHASHSSNHREVGTFYD
jgi:hypothetical protein